MGSDTGRDDPLSSRTPSGAPVPGPTPDSPDPPTALPYTYDNVGNIGSKTTYGASPATTSYSYNSANQLVTAGSTNYTYDANGNEKTAGSNWWRSGSAPTSSA